MTADLSAGSATIAAYQLVADYARYLDLRDVEGFTRLFAPDGALQIGATRRIEGRQALGEFLQRTPSGVHVPGLPSVMVEEDRVRALSTTIFLDSESGVSRAVTNEDLFVWNDGQLLIGERRIEIRASSNVTQP